MKVSLSYNFIYSLFISRPMVFCKKGDLRNFTKFKQKHQFIKKETLAQVFSCEFCEILKNTFLHGTSLGAASVLPRIVILKYSAGIIIL